MSAQPFATHLLLAHDDDDRPSVLPAGPDASTAAAQARPVPVDEVPFQADITADVNDLEKQRWAIVVPRGARGKRLEALVQDLCDQRADDQGADVLTIEAPEGMNETEAWDWKNDIYPGLYGDEEEQRPRYLCILGDVDGVSLATQEVLATDGLPGRLVCNGDRGYGDYVAKVLASERDPAEHNRPRSLFYTVHDSSAATESGYQKLMSPCFDRCKDAWESERDTFPAAALKEHGDRYDPDPDELLDVASSACPTVLFSLSHGMGPPRRRRWSRGEARDRQGAMSFGMAGALAPSDIASRPFLPGGLWLYKACFGAGTPRVSAYHHWLEMLVDHGGENAARLRAVLAGLAREGGFTSGLARAALSNPKGPLAMIAHMDLAWSYSYEELRVGKSQRVQGATRVNHFKEVIAKMVKGERAGAALLSMRLVRGAVGERLNTRYDLCKRAGVAPEGASVMDRLALGHLWLLRQDLSGYVLLGDPAARLPLAAESGLADAELRSRLFAGLGIGGFSPPGHQSRADGRLSCRERAAIMERAILARLGGEPMPEIIAEHAGDLDLDADELERWERAYREAGRAELARLAAATEV